MIQINNSSETLWYAGSQNTQHIIVIKRPPSLFIAYAIGAKSLRIMDIDKFEFSNNEDRWVNLKTSNLKFN